MEIVFTVLILLLAVALSGAGARLLPFSVPLPLVQIALGALLAAPAFGLHVVFDPGLFMLLFIPPLLFADGWRIPKREFFMQRRAILALALGLVFITVLLLGYFVHALVRAIPLPVAFALAAVLSPTDAVALGGIAGKNRIAPQLMYILEGEALMNDASGLVALKFAIAAALTGAFSLHEAALSFVVIAAGGLAIGALVAWVVNFALARFMSAFSDDEAGPVTVMTLLLPFAAYLFAERFGCSGILAAVAAGMTMNRSSMVRLGSAAARMHAASTWAMVEFVFNGMVFILLGLQLPHIIGGAFSEAHRSGAAQLWRLVGYVGAVTGVLYALRFAWVWLLRWFASRAAARHGVANAVPGLRTAAITTVAGVRGAVTLAGVLSLPVLLPDGSALPGRNLTIFLAASVILVSLAVAVIALPLLLNGARRGPDPHDHEEQRARKLSAQAAIRAVDASHDTETAELDEATAALATDAAARVMNRYRLRLSRLTDDEPALAAQRAGLVETRLWLTALRAERATLLMLREQQQINDETLDKLMREIDLTETAVTGRG